MECKSGCLPIQLAIVGEGLALFWATFDSTIYCGTRSAPQHESHLFYYTQNGENISVRAKEKALLMFLPPCVCLCAQAQCPSVCSWSPSQ